MPAPQQITPQERRLQLLLKILAFVFGIAALGYLLPALTGPNKAAFIQLPFVTNSVVKVSVLGLIAWFASADARRYRMLTLLVIVGHIISEVAVAAVLLWGDTTGSLSLSLPFMSGWVIVSIKTALVGSMVLDGVIIILLVWFYTAAERARYGLLYLSPLEYRSLVALADVVVTGEKRIITPEEVATNVDRYLSRFNAQSKWITKLVLTAIEIYPMLSLKPPLSHINAEDRLAFVKKRFYQDVTLRLVPEFWRMLVQAMIRLGKQLSYLGYYNDPRTFESVGYVPFSKREDTKEKLQKSPPPARLPLQVDTPSDITSETVTADVCIIGTGAAASILARELTRGNPSRSVLMLERGDYTDPSEFTEDEAEMLTKLYSDGALQLSRDFRFQVLQGSCVGGTTVVNNAVCFDLPEEVLDRWNNEDSLKAGLNSSNVMNSMAAVRKLIGVERQIDDSEGFRFLNPGAKSFNDGVHLLGHEVLPNEHLEVEANIHGCLGCGYCNIGCAYGKKLSMLDTVLPQTQKEVGRDGLRIIAGCEALSFQSSGKRIKAVTCRLKDGRRLDVRANTFVLSAGAVSSSIILLRSSIAVGRAGKRLSFNMGSPMTGVFPDVINSYSGLQISHYLKLSPTRGYITETWFNPPVSQALTMPGWFDDHFKNMLRYNRIACTGVLVGTESNGQVTRRGLIGREIDYTPTKGDLEKLIEGLIISGRAFLKSNAESVIPNTFDYHEFKTEDELYHLRDLVKDASDITIGTGHPQGGNVLSANPRIGVVDSEFKAYGYDNLYVCDASVFPSSVGVNPQLTVMTLAHYAAPFIANAKEKRETANRASAAGS